MVVLEATEEEVEEEEWIEAPGIVEGITALENIDSNGTGTYNEEDECSKEEDNAPFVISWAVIANGEFSISYVW